MKKIVLVLFVLSFVIGGCAVKAVTTRYDIGPEMKGEIFKAKEAKQMSLTFKYYKHQWPRPMISTSENISPDAEQIKVGEKFFEIVKEELKNRGFSMNDISFQSSPMINVEIGFMYNKSIPLVTTGSIATRWKVAFKNTPLFEIADFKLLAVLTGIGGTFSEEKGKELANLITNQFIAELESIK